MTPNQLILDPLLIAGIGAIGVVFLFHKNKQVVSWSQIILSILLVIVVSQNNFGTTEGSVFWIVIICNAGFGVWGLLRRKKR